MADVSTLDVSEALRHFPGFASARIIQYNSSTGRIEWRSQSSAIDHGSLGGLSDDDHTQYALLAGRSGGQTLNGGTASGNNLSLVSTAHATKGNIFLNAAGTIVAIDSTAVMQAVVFNGTTGFQVNSAAASGNYLRGNGTNFVSNTIQVADLPSHGASSHDNRTRRIGLRMMSNATVVAAVDVHTSIGNVQHWHAADGGTTIAYFEPVITPSDFVSGMKLCISYSSTAGGNSIVMQHVAVNLSTDAAGSQTVSLSTGDTARAVNAAADTTTELKITFGTDPTADQTVICYVQFTRGHASDSNTGSMSLWDYWLEYTADG